MNCLKAREIIDQQVFGSKISPETELQQHLEECAECKKYLHDAMKLQQVIHKVQTQQPELKNPGDFTSSIMSVIETGEGGPFAGRKIPARQITLAIRMLAAACIILLISFGFEQYRILQKLQKLEVTARQFPGMDDEIAFRSNLDTFRIAEIPRYSNDGNKSHMRAQVAFALLKESDLTIQDLQQLSRYSQVLRQMPITGQITNQFK